MMLLYQIKCCEYLIYVDFSSILSFGFALSQIMRQYVNTSEAGGAVVGTFQTTDQHHFQLSPCWKHKSLVHCIHLF